MEETEFDYDEPRASFDLLKARFELCQGDLQRAKAERDEALELVDTMRENMQESSDLIESWIDVFDMQKNDAGFWIYNRDQVEIWKLHDELLTEFNKLVRDWNKFVPRYNATINPKNAGRPLAASDAQVAKVKELRRGGHSLRATAKETGLSLRTVRTILDNAAGKPRDDGKAKELRRREFNRMRAAAFRARKRKLEATEKELNRVLKESTRLQKAARGLARSTT